MVHFLLVELKMPYLNMWVVYDRPRDYPNKIVARRWLIDKEAHPTDEFIEANSIDEIRERFDQVGLVRLERNPQDDACIVETWM